MAATARLTFANVIQFEKVNFCKKTSKVVPASRAAPSLPTSDVIVIFTMQVFAVPAVVAVNDFLCFVVEKAGPQKIISLGNFASVVGREWVGAACQPTCLFLVLTSGPCGPMLAGIVHGSF